MKSLAAHTPTGMTYPPYLSINLVNGAVKVTVRSAPRRTRCMNSADQAGSTAEITLSLSEFDDVLGQIERNLQP